MEESSDRVRTGGVNVSSDDDIVVGRDIVGRDKITNVFNYYANTYSLRTEVDKRRLQRDVFILGVTFYDVSTFFSKNYRAPLDAFKQEVIARFESDKSILRELLGRLGFEIFVPDTSHGLSVVYDSFPLGFHGEPIICTREAADQWQQINEVRLGSYTDACGTRCGALFRLGYTLAGSTAWILHDKSVEDHCLAHEKPIPLDGHLSAIRSYIERADLPSELFDNTRHYIADIRRLARSNDEDKWDRVDDVRNNMIRHVESSIEVN